MRTHARAVWLWSAVLTAALVVTRPLAGGGVTVHEWGTFTSIAGLDGWSVNWAPLAGPQDLPCFVEEQKATTPQGLTSIQIKGRDLLGLLRLLRPLAGTAATLPRPAPAPKPPPTALPPPILTGKIRMETPVLYFYSPAEVTLNVKVSFVQGAMSEWYPTATVSALDLRQPLATTTGTIEWPSVRVRPGAEVALPRTTGESHYYAARDVDAAPVQVAASTSGSSSIEAWRTSSRRWPPRSPATASSRSRRCRRCQWCCSRTARGRSGIASCVRRRRRSSGRR